MPSARASRRQHKVDNSRQDTNNVIMPPPPPPPPQPPLTTTTNTRTQPEVMNMNHDKSLLERQFYSTNEPIELTCALGLTDELDLELTQVEWWQLARVRKPTLLWSSNSNANINNGQPLITHSTSTTLKDEPLMVAAPKTMRDHAVIDYVTRANATLRHHINGELEPQVAAQTQGSQLGRNKAKWPLMGGGANSNEEETTTIRMRRTKLIRVGHLIVDAPASVSVSGLVASPPSIGGVAHHHQHQHQHQEPATTSSSSSERLYLCRVTNSAGRLDVLYSLTNIEVARKEQQLEWRRRQELRAKLASAAASASASASDPSNDSNSSSNNNNMSGTFHRWPRKLDWLSSVQQQQQLGRFAALERAKSAVAGELIRMSQQQSDDLGLLKSEEPLFILVNQPQELLLAATSSSSSSEASQPQLEELSSSARSLNQQDHQRPATRQTVNGNSTSSQATTTARIIHSQEPTLTLTPTPTPTPTTTQSSGEWLTLNYLNKTIANKKRVPLHSIALGLVGRYTSNRKSLIELDGLEGEDEFAAAVTTNSRQPVQADGEEPIDDGDDDFSAAGQSSIWSLLVSQASSSPNQQQQPFAKRVSKAYELLYSKYLNKGLKLLSGEASLLLGIFCGLLAGCLLTILLIPRLRCSLKLGGGRRVGDSSASLSGSPPSSDDNKRGKREDEFESPPDERELNYISTANTMKPDAGKEGGGSGSSRTTNGSQRKLIVSATESYDDDDDERDHEGGDFMERENSAHAVIVGTESAKSQHVGYAAAADNQYAASQRQALCSSWSLNEAHVPTASALLNGSIGFGNFGSQQQTAASLQRNRRRSRNTNNKLAAGRECSSSNNNNNNNFLPSSASCNNRLFEGGGGGGGEHRLIVVAPQQEIQEAELVGPTPFYQANQRQERLTSDADSSLVAYHAPAAAAYNQQQLEYQQVVAGSSCCSNDASSSRAYLASVSGAIQRTPYIEQWPTTTTTTSCEETTMDQDSSSSLLLPQNGGGGQQFTLVEAPPELRSFNGDTLVLSPTSYTCDSSGNLIGYSFQEDTQPQTIYYDHTNLQQRTNTLHLPAQQRIQTLGRLNIKQQQQHNYVDFTPPFDQPLPIMVSPAASTSSSTINTSNNSYNQSTMNHHQGGGQHQVAPFHHKRRLKFGGLVSKTRDEEGGALTTTKDNAGKEDDGTTNLVYLDDALKLLESSVKDCL